VSACYLFDLLTLIHRYPLNQNYFRINGHLWISASN